MCIFCKIVNKEIASYCIYEDDKVMAFLDISQVTKGHTLVIPKQHYDNFIECDDETLTHLIRITKMLAKHIMEKTNAEGMNVLSNIKEIAGQSVEHFHIHLIPRYTKEDACVIQFYETPEQNMEDIRSLLKVS